MCTWFRVLSVRVLRMRPTSSTLLLPPILPMRSMYVPCSRGGRMPSFTGGITPTGVCVCMSVCALCFLALSFWCYQLWWSWSWCFFVFFFASAMTVWFLLVIWVESLPNRLHPLLSSGGLAVVGWRTATSSMSGWLRKTMSSLSWWENNHRHPNGP